MEYEFGIPVALLQYRVVCMYCEVCLHHVTLKSGHQIIKLYNTRFVL